MTEKKLTAGKRDFIKELHTSYVNEVKNLIEYSNEGLKLDETKSKAFERAVIKHWKYYDDEYIDAALSEENIEWTKEHLGEKFWGVGCISNAYDYFREEIYCNGAITGALEGGDDDEWIEAMREKYFTFKPEEEEDDRIWEDAS